MSAYHSLRLFNNAIARSAKQQIQIPKNNVNIIQLFLSNVDIYLTDDRKDIISHNWHDWHDYSYMKQIIYDDCKFKTPLQSWRISEGRITDWLEKLPEECTEIGCLNVESQKDIISLTIKPEHVDVKNILFNTVNYLKSQKRISGDTQFGQRF